LGTNKLVCLFPLTPGFSQVRRRSEKPSRFNGFISPETVETVFSVLLDCTGLKPGVNESDVSLSARV